MNKYLPEQNISQNLKLLGLVESNKLLHLIYMQLFLFLQHFSMKLIIDSEKKKNGALHYFVLSLENLTFYVPQAHWNI